MTEEEQIEATMTNIMAIYDARGDLEPDEVIARETAENVEEEPPR